MSEGSEPLDFDEAALMRTFRSDAEDHLTAMEELLLGLGEGEPSPVALGHLLRLAHTIKGDASCLGLTEVTSLAHRIEDALVEVRDNGRALSPEEIHGLFANVDVLRELIFGGPVPGEPGRPGGEAGPSGHRGAEGTVRVEIDKLDQLLHLLGEIASVRGELSRQLEDLSGDGRHRAMDAQANLERMHLGLQERLLQIRMVPLSRTFRAYQRAVRDLALELGKQARLVLVGSEVEVDAAVVEPLRELLTHLVRNAVDHGIEAPAVRRARGKDPVGVVQIRSFHDMGHVVIEVSDDGGGLDRKRIVEVARAQGLIDDEVDPESVDLGRLIFAPGLSTAAEVTRVSGRGVGMDTAWRSIQALRGQLEVASLPGEGTTITVRLPLSLAQGFALRTAGQTYVVPLDAVVECVDAPGGLRDDELDTAVMDLRGGPLPVLHLGRVLGMGRGEVGRRSVVVLQHGRGRVGLVVDRLLGACQTTAQPLGPACDEAFGIAGSTILQDGEVALLLDVAQVVTAVETEAGNANTDVQDRPTGPVTRSEAR